MTPARRGGAATLLAVAAAANLVARASVVVALVIGPAEGLALIGGTPGWHRFCPIITALNDSMGRIGFSSRDCPW